MKRWLVAALFLLAVSVAPAFADYVIIIATPAQPPDPAGVPPADGGAPPAPRTPPKPGELWLDPAVALPFGAVIVEIEEIHADKMKAMPLTITHKWGKSYLLHPKTRLCDVVVIYNKAYKLKSPRERFADMEKTFKDKGAKEKPKDKDVLDFAEFTLKHGWIKKYAEIMDKFAQDQPAHEKSVSFLKVKADLDRPAKHPEGTVARTPLLKDYRSQTSDHYIAYFKSRSDNVPEIGEHLTRLENTFRGLYYWFAMQGIPLPVPTERQIAVVTFKDEEFNLFKEVLTATPDMADSYIGRREGVLVLSAKRLDEAYNTLEKYTSPWWTQGIDRAKVLESIPDPQRPAAGDSAFPAAMASYKGAVAEVQTGALALKAMESDSETAAITHNGTRQLLFASGLLPRNVAAPEWLQFGLSSFFETPMGSPGLSVGMASTEYLPAYRDLKKHGRFKGKPAEILQNIVTEHDYRQALMENNSGRVRELRAASWALTYYLANKRLDGLQKYLKELWKMPRDMELDEDTLLWVFCKSFGLLDGSGKMDQKKCSDFADSWNKYIDEERLELQGIVDGMRTMVAAKLWELGPVEPNGDPPVASEPNNPGKPANPMRPQTKGNPPGRPPGGSPMPPPGQRPPVPPKGKKGPGG